MIVETLLPRMAAVLNRGIHSRRDAVEVCEALAGKSVLLRIEGLPTGTTELMIAASSDAISLALAGDALKDAPDAVVSGSPIELVRLVMDDRDRSNHEGRVSCDGDPAVVDQFRDLISKSVPDLEDRLAAWFGEPTAFQVTNLLLDIRDWVVDSADEIAERTVEYLQEDSGRLPTSAETRRYCTDVDELAGDVGQLETRIQHIVDREAR